MYPRSAAWAILTAPRIRSLPQTWGLALQLQFRRWVAAGAPRTEFAGKKRDGLGHPWRV